MNFDPDFWKTTGVYLEYPDDYSLFLPLLLWLDNC
jgi:hypothetical protein